MSRNRAFLRLAALSLLLPIGAAAQVDRGSIKGVVHDEQNAVVPSATLSLKNEATGVVSNSQSLASGEYTFVSLPAGSYMLTSTAANFGKSVQTHILVAVGSVSALDVTLHPASVQTTVEVSSVGDTVDTETSEIGTAITPREIEDLPVPMSSDMRNPLSFVALTPGVYGSTPGADEDYRLHVSGSPSDSNEVYIDGIPIASTGNAGDISRDHPPIDAISQFKVVNNNASAQYGFASSAVSFAFKSGTNRPHGTLFEYLQNDKLNANGFVGNALGQKRAPLKQNEYGGTFGGPIWIPKLYNGRDKSFFFAEYSRFSWRPSSNNAGLTTFPTAYRNGDFSGALGPQLKDSKGNLVTDLLGRPVYQGEIYDPQSTQQVVVNGTSYTVRNPFQDNKIPLTRFSGVSKNILSAFPQATNNGINNNFFRVNSTKNDEDRFVLRLDHSITPKHNISGSVFLGNYDTSNNGSLSLLNADSQSAPTKQFRMSYNYAHSAQTSNNLNFGFLRDNFTDGPVQYGPGLDALGIKGFPAQLGQQPYPSVGLLGTIPGSPATGIGGFNVSHVVQNRFIVTDNLTHTIGHHSLMFGGELRRLQRNENVVGVAGFTFDAPETASNGVGLIAGTNTTTTLPTGSGNSAASFLVGAVDFSDSNFPISQGYRWLQTGVYAQDDWRALPSLVLNLGLRYDVQVPRTEVNGYASTVDPNLPNPAVGNYPGAFTFYGNGPGRNGKPRIGNIDYKAIQPRIGFAFTPFGNQKTVIRGGFSIIRPASNDNLENGIGSAQYSVGFSGAAISSKPGDSVGSPAFYWDNAFPANAVTGAALNPGILVGLTNPTIISPKAGSPSTQQNWALQIQHELPGKMIATVGYVGSHSYHIGVWTKPNQINPQVAGKYAAAAAACNCDFYDQPVSSAAATAAGVPLPFQNFAAVVGPAAATIGQALRPFPQYGSVDFPINPIGSVGYNGLQTSLQRRASANLTFLLSYTFSKTIGNVDSQDGVGAGAENAIYGASFYQDYYNPGAERSVTSSDIPHVVALSYTYKLPVGKGQRYLNHGGVANAVLGGWQVSGINQYQSGRPIHIEYDAFGAANPYRATDGYSFRPNVTGQPLKNPNYKKSCSGPSNLAQFHQTCSFYINPEAFAAPPQGQFGNAPHFFSSLRLPAYLNENLSASKRFPLYKETDLHFEANFFNAFNRTIFSSGGNAVTFIQNQAPSSLSTAAASNSIFGLWTSQQNAPRVIQFALKLEF